MDLILKDRYAVVEKIGKGGMAEIFRALIKGPRGFEKEVCIKRILPEYSDNPGFEAMFLDEARLAAALQHANIVQVFDFDRDEEGRYFIVMEYVDGVNLKSVKLRARELSTKLDTGFAAAVAKSVLEALHHAWTRRVGERRLEVVHRDLSPHNILISREGEVKITDFGIAKAVTSAVRTRAGIVKGKLAYMSPEQAAGRGTDHRSDLYSLGIVLWELVAGRRLFQEAADARRPPLEAERRGVKSLKTVDGDVSRAFSAFVDRLLELEPDSRPGSALEALEMLERTGANTWSTIRTGALLVELGFFGEEKSGVDVGRAGEASSSLSPPGSGSTLKPLSTHSTATLMKSRGKGKRSFLRSRLFFAAAAGIPAACAAALAAAVLVGGPGGGSEGPRRAVESPGAVGIPRPGSPEVGAAAGGPARGEASPGKEGGEAAAVTPQTAEEGDAERSRRGWVSINARPWAEVVIDGKKKGYTPLKRFSLPAGAHKIVLRNPDLGAEKKMTLRIRAGREKNVIVDLRGGS